MGEGAAGEDVKRGQLRCPECGNPNIAVDVEHGESFCSDCGLVLLAQEAPGGSKRARL